jgi:hypothetical protein
MPCIITSQWHNRLSEITGFSKLENELFHLPLFVSHLKKSKERDLLLILTTQACESSVLNISVMRKEIQEHVPEP